MKKLALVLALVLAYGSIAAAATPTFSTSVAIEGSQTWTNGNPSSTTPVNPSVTMNAAAKGDGYDVAAELGATNAPALGKWNAKLTDGGLTVNLWGKNKELTDIKTPFEYVIGAKKATDWKARALYKDFTLEIENAATPVWRSFYSKKLSDTLTVGGAAVKNLNGQDDGNAVVDVYGTGKLGGLDVKGEVSKSVTDAKKNGLQLGVEASSTFVAGIKTTGRFTSSTANDSIRSDVTNVVKISNDKADMFLTTSVELKNRTAGKNLAGEDIAESGLTIQGKQEKDLTYIEGIYSQVKDVPEWSAAPAPANVKATGVQTLTANLKMRGSKEQVWGDVFKNEAGKNQVWKNKSWVAALSLVNTSADSNKNDAKNANASTVITAEGVYNLIPAKAWAYGKFVSSSDKDGVGNDVTKPAAQTVVDMMGRYILTAKVNIDPRANVTIKGESVNKAAKANTSTMVGAKATYTFATDMSVNADLSNTSVKTDGVDKAAQTKVVTVGYSVKF